MIVHYDMSKHKWYSDIHTTNTLGSNHYELNKLHKKDESNLTFSLQEQNKQIGPIIGILTSTNKYGRIAGNFKLFKSLQIALFKQQALSFIFTCEDVKNNEIKGYIYLPDKDKWIVAYFPFPHIVYNRIPYRKEEKKAIFQQTLNFFSQKNIPFFNPKFIEKDELISVLEKEDTLKKYIPETMVITNCSSLMEFLESKQKLYIKPVDGSKGKGIFTLEKSEENKLIVEYIDGILLFDNETDFWHYFERLKEERKYIAQENIDVALIDGHRYDFRILITYTNKKYVLAGVGIRQSVTQEVTTHLPNGGVILPYSSIQTAEHDKFITELVESCGKTLSNHFGFFGEFSIDACIDKQNNYYIYEINSKPMHFEETDIEENRIHHLIQLFRELTIFSNKV